MVRFLRGDAKILLASGCARAVKRDEESIFFRTFAFRLSAGAPTQVGQEMARRDRQRPAKESSSGDEVAETPARQRAKARAVRRARSASTTEKENESVSTEANDNDASEAPSARTQSQKLGRAQGKTASVEKLHSDSEELTPSEVSSNASSSRSAHRQARRRAAAENENTEHPSPIASPVLSAREKMLQRKANTPTRAAAAASPAKSGKASILRAFRPRPVTKSVPEDTEVENGVERSDLASDAEDTATSGDGDGDDDGGEECDVHKRPPPPPSPARSASGRLFSVAAHVAGFAVRMRRKLEEADADLLPNYDLDTLLKRCPGLDPGLAHKLMMQTTSIILHRTDELQHDPRIAHPLISVSIVNLKTGTLQQGHFFN